MAMGLFKSKEEKLALNIKSLLEKQYGFEFELDKRDNGAVTLSNVMEYKNKYLIHLLIYVCDIFVSMDSTLFTEIRMDSLQDPVKTMLEIMDETECYISKDDNDQKIELELCYEIEYDYAEKDPRSVLSLTRTLIHHMSQSADDLVEMGLM